LDDGINFDFVIQGWFIIDLVSVIPFDIAAMLTAGGREDKVGTCETQKKAIQSCRADMLLMLGNLKILRVLRLMRLAKLLRILRASRILRRLQSKMVWSFR
jgi:hypothetical protein